MKHSAGRLYTISPKTASPPARFAIKECQARKKENPLRQGALVSKDDIRAFQPHEPELRTCLATTMWLQKAIEELPESHPNQFHLQEMLRNEPTTPSTPRSTSRRSSNIRISPASFLDLPVEVRNLIYENSAQEGEPISPVLDVHDRETPYFNSGTQEGYLKSGLPVLLDIYPQLQAELRAMLPTFYRANTFQFDLRGDTGGDSLQRWIEQKHDEASAARKISLKHWTWYYNASEGWEHVPDETILSLTPSGHVRVTRIARQLHPLACSCEMDDFVSTQCPDWKINKLWSVADFVSALRQEEGLLIQAVNKLVELIHYHNETFHVWREGPKPCKLCGKQMIFIRSFDDVEWTSD